MGTYDDIGIPVGNTKISASTFGVKVRNAIIDLDARLLIREAAEMMPANQNGAANGINSLSSAAGVWANLPTNTFSVVVTNPSSVFAMVCSVYFGAWMQAASGDVRLGINVTGGVVSDPDPGPNSPVGFGNLPLTSSTTATQCMGYMTLTIPAGASPVTLTPQGKRSAAVTAQINYPSLEVVPFRFQV